MKVYLDLCVYNRPFDDQTNERIFIEARAFYIVIKWLEEGKIIIIHSDALEYENSLTSNPDRRRRVKSYLSLAKEFVKLSDFSIRRASEIINLGFREMDALHIAMAEEGKAHYFVTCDDGIIDMAEKNQERLKVKVCSILEFLEEVMGDVKND
jgi:predicted nucleic acid-binding protein